MRSLVAAMLPLLTVVVLLGCSKSNEGEWVPVEIPKTEEPALSPEEQEQRENVRRLAMEARVNKMRAALIKDDEATCTRDEECELTAFHCCNCGGGGRMAAARSDALPEVLRRRGIVCAEYACAQVVSDDPTCSAERAVCREGKCVPDVPASTPPAPEGIGVEPIPEQP